MAGSVSIVNPSLATGNNANSSAIGTSRHTKMAVLVKSTREVTIKAQVSPDGTNWFDASSKVIPIGNTAATLDIPVGLKVRLNVANASGQSADVDVQGYLR